MHSLCGTIGPAHCRQGWRIAAATSNQQPATNDHEPRPCMHEKEWLAHSSLMECQSRNPRRCYSKRRGSRARYCVKQHDDLDQERLCELPVAPRYCIDAQGSSKHTDLEIFTPQICVRCCAKASYTPSPTVRVKRPAQRVPWRAVAQRFIQRAKAGGGGGE